MAEVKVQDGVFYIMYLSREAEEAYMRAIPEVDTRACWEADLQKIGALQTFEEHVMLVRVTSGRRHK
jgi:uncharacterized protein (DUF169 family)